jgi:hypothetical protein
LHVKTLTGVKDGKLIQVDEDTMCEWRYQWPPRVQFARVRGMVHDIPKNNQFYGPLETTFTGEIGIIMICKLINGLR